MIEKIYFDLDGPILDTSERHYSLYKDILIEKEFTYLSKEKYWELKKRKTPTEKILNYTGAEEILLYFKKEWMQRIEEEKYLLLDKKQNGTSNVLENLAKSYQLILVTIRSNSNGLLSQLNRFSISKYFQEILSSPHKGEIPRNIKIRLINSSKYFDPHQSVIVGDSEADILAGKYLGIYTIGVLNGIRTDKLLNEFGADIIVEDIYELIEVITKLKR